MRIDKTKLVCLLVSECDTYEYTETYAALKAKKNSVCSANGYNDCNCCWCALLLLLLLLSPPPPLLYLFQFFWNPLFCARSSSYSFCCFDKIKLATQSKNLSSVFCCGYEIMRALVKHTKKWFSATNWVFGKWYTPAPAHSMFSVLPIALHYTLTWLNEKEGEKKQYTDITAGISSANCVFCRIELFSEFCCCFFPSARYLVEDLWMRFLMKIASRVSFCFAHSPSLYCIDWYTHLLMANCYYYLPCGLFVLFFVAVVFWMFAIIKHFDSIFAETRKKRETTQNVCWKKELNYIRSVNFTRKFIYGRINTVSPFFFSCSPLLLALNWLFVHFNLFHLLCSFVITNVTHNKRLLLMLIFKVKFLLFCHIL